MSDDDGYKVRGRSTLAGWLEGIATWVLPIVLMLGVIVAVAVRCLR